MIVFNIAMSKAGSYSPLRIWDIIRGAFSPSALRGFKEYWWAITQQLLDLTFSNRFYSHPKIVTIAKLSRNEIVKDKIINYKNEENNRLQ